MKKKIYRLSILTFILLFCSGCLAETLYVGAYVIEGAKLATALTSSDKNSSSEKQTDSSYGKQRERMMVGNYDISVRDGYYNKKTCILFVACSNGQPVKVIYFDKDNSEDIKMMDNFFKMTEAEKKEFIKNQFNELAKFDLGPIAENVAPEKTETISSATIPAMGFR